MTQVGRNAPIEQLSEREAHDRIAELVQQAYDALSEATRIADQHKIEFDFSPAYGMGGTYLPAGSQDPWSASTDALPEGQWQSSSHSC